MASASRSGELVLSTGNETLKGTVAGTTLDCRVRLGVGLGARIAPGQYSFSPPTEYSRMGTVARATFSAAGRQGRGVHKLGSTPLLRGESNAVLFNPDRVQIDKNVPWHDGSAGGEAKGETDLLRWTGVGSPGTLLFAARSTGAGNNVVVLTSFDPLMRSLTFAGGCPLIVTA